MSLIAKLAEQVRLKEKVAREAALRAIPEEYQDYLMFLQQNECLINREPIEEKREYPLPQGVFEWKSKTYIQVEAPYMVVAGRLKWFRDDHREAGAKCSITTNVAEIREMIRNGQPIPPGYPFVTFIESEIHGRVEALASIHIDGRAVDATHPLENAETSSLGRALAKMGYGLIGSGLASAEEVEEAMKRRSEKENPKASTKPSGETEKPELVEIASNPKDVPTSKGTYISYELADGRILMTPGDSPRLPVGSKICVSGIISESKTGDLVLWAKELEGVA
jgi:hypothetical protein